MINWLHQWITKWLLYCLGWFFPYKTRKKRKQIYKSMLLCFDSCHHGFCSLLNTCEPRYCRIWTHNDLWRFPELYIYRPVRKFQRVWWWDISIAGRSKRRAILNKISK